MVAWDGIGNGRMGKIRASEQDRPDIAQARQSWKSRQGRLDPVRLVFLDESGAKTNMTRRFGTGSPWRASPCQRSGWPLAEHHDDLLDPLGWQHRLHDHPGSHRHRSFPLLRARNPLSNAAAGGLGHHGQPRPPQKRPHSAPDQNVGARRKAGDQMGTTEFCSGESGIDRLGGRSGGGACVPLSPAIRPSLWERGSGFLRRGDRR